ncbi:cyclic peptide export ABC transporter [Planctomycetes bacterium K23_9]|uniref:ABC transporter ATP-binding protein YojI n=1 Tax=Stieleria marina TaxID=1930275 RepID=A0A517P0K0_9BACT|nr:ABC transporter ATP-binding protein YojI [Planctomycetes bacterium K23_9]
MSRNSQYDSVLRFFRDAGKSSFGHAVAFATISGVANAAVLAVINQVGHAFDAEQIPRVHLLQFVVFTIVFVICKWQSFRSANGVVETALARLRDRIVDKLRRTELLFMETLEQSEIYAQVTGDIGQVSQNMFRIVSNLQSALLIVFCLIYLAFVSFPVMIMTIIAIFCMFLAHTVGARMARDLLRRVNQSEARLFSILHSLFYGFKEIKLNSARSDALFDTLSKNTKSNTLMRQQAGMLTYYRIMRAEIALYLLLGSTVFILPQYVLLDAPSMLKVITVLLFLLQPTRALSDSLYNATYAGAVLDRMYALEETIDNELARSPPPSPVLASSPYANFQKISFENLCFTYRDSQGNATFAAGPLNLEIERGETLFLIGGNGSGKSTTFKLMTGLYRAESGNIRVDGNLIPWNMIGRYRQMISAVYGDFYLFDRCYGLENVDEVEVAKMLHRMRLEDKVTFSNGRFSTQDLSTGQRKRLALITSLMEDREVYFLDEWAADQDREFRDYFYRTLLPDFKAKGKTVVAITHHERFLDAADRVVRLELGRVTGEGAELIQSADTVE